MAPVPDIDDVDGNEDISQDARRKKLKRSQACDICRRKKVRCDGGERPGRRCSPCDAFDRECTYDGTFTNEKALSKKYVAELEARIEELERILLKCICPNCGSATLVPSSYTDTILRDLNPFQQVSRTLKTSPTVSHKFTETGAEELEGSDDEAPEQYTLIQSLRQLQLNPDALRFLGKSSSANLVRAAINTKRQSFEGSQPNSQHGQHHRPQFWNSHPWLDLGLLVDAKPFGPDSFPEPDLMRTLIDLYFVNMNLYLPLLHRPTYEANIADGLHLRELGFGCTVLLVCAVGARFTEDPRVYLKGHETDPLSRGWKWFNMVLTVHRSWLCLPQLYDLQICCLVAQFMESTSSSQATWAIIGIGIRLAQDVGAHRKKVYNRQHRVEEELWKRAFWILVVLDKGLSAVTGRPCAIQDEDYDLDYLTECDEEYWMHPNPDLAFKQPPGKPSTVAFFNCTLRLVQILAFVQRTIYSSKKHKTMMGVTGPEWEEKIVRELDSALNRWLNTVPEHLRWDPNMENQTFLNQSAHLYINYYQIQIFLHRPFIQSPRRTTSQAFPSLAICTNAARACIHILDHQYKRTKFLMFSDQGALVVSNIVLLLNIWGSKRSGVSINVAKEMVDVQKCMDLLKQAEKHWYLAGRGWDILHELAYVGDLPPLMQSPFPSRKRNRNGESSGNTAVADDLREMFSTPERINTNNVFTFLNPDARLQPQTSLDQQGDEGAMQELTVMPSPPHTNGAEIASVQPIYDAHHHAEQPRGYHQQYDAATAPPFPYHLHLSTPANGGLSQESAFTTSAPSHSPENGNYVYPSTEPIPTPGNPNANHSLPIDHADSISGMQASGGPVDVANWSTQPTNNDMLAMLVSMPTGFEWSDWDAYIGTMSGMNNASGTGSFRGEHG
ncbi:hypothetical protein WOLCODRAFT_161704 [Wolfiporia cocos MD-104 SS10]|uniref:Zn(2)-C6 fungal-type domain-containing protein n=1 Tax=Wolfiporia cocos (strain MD-104) TaxID=742152 RepID=A0A2H3JRI6_WOLCO|nr:hypothetical protein WOLCODRAFT_161704 [Wolfiporia cocos MD-104 SS10]